MKYNTFNCIYDTEKTYVTADTQAAFNALCENVKPLTGDKNRDCAIKFLNAALDVKYLTAEAKAKNK